MSPNPSKRFALTVYEYTSKSNGIDLGGFAGRNRFDAIDFRNKVSFRLKVDRVSQCFLGGFLLQRKISMGVYIWIRALFLRRVYKVTFVFCLPRMLTHLRAPPSPRKNRRHLRSPIIAIERLFIVHFLLFLY